MVVTSYMPQEKELGKRRSVVFNISPTGSVEPKEVIGCIEESSGIVSYHRYVTFVRLG